MEYPGKPRSSFITVEGIEGSGKTTQIRKAADWLRGRGGEVVLTREPGGCTIADSIRAILLDASHQALSPKAELLLYLAARAQHVDEVIRPALAAGKTVLCDRFADATEAYQGYARGLGVMRVRQLGLEATGGLSPDLTIFLDLSVEAGLDRARSRADAIEETAQKEDRFEREAMDFHRRVREGYLAIADREPDRVRVVDASGSEEEVFRRVLDALTEIIGETHD